MASAASWRCCGVSFCGTLPPAPGRFSERARSVILSRSAITRCTSAAPLILTVSASPTRAAPSLRGFRSHA